jgi:ATP-dependent Clp protease ATP-binding subunit ClpA
MRVRENLVAGKHASHPSVTERFTEATSRAIHFAQSESLRRGASATTVADLLAGLGVDENSRAERIGSLKVNAFYLRWLVGLPALPARAEQSIESGQENQQSQLELDIEAKRALGFAVMEADRDREYWIDSDHLLRGILRFPNRAHFAILKLELDLHSARAASKADRQKFPSHQASSMKVFKYLIRKHLALWVPPILGLACYLYILIEGFGLTASPLTR